MECLFCSIVKGDIPSENVYEDDDVVAFKDINPVADTHIIFIPKKHFANISESSKEKGVNEKIFKAIDNYVEKENLIESGYRIVINTGKLAQQSVEHIHVHLITGRLLQWPPG